jgi:hypothetical protein
LGQTPASGTTGLRHGLNNINHAGEVGFASPVTAWLQNAVQAIFTHRLNCRFRKLPGLLRYSRLIPNDCDNRRNPSSKYGPREGKRGRLINFRFRHSTL